MQPLIIKLQQPVHRHFQLAYYQIYHLCIPFLIIRFSILYTRYHIMHMEGILPAFSQNICYSFEKVQTVMQIFQALPPEELFP